MVGVVITPAIDRKFHSPSRASMVATTSVGGSTSMSSPLRKSFFKKATFLFKKSRA